MQIVASYNKILEVRYLILYYEGLQYLDKINFKLVQLKIATFKLTAVMSKMMF